MCINLNINTKNISHLIKIFHYIRKENMTILLTI